ncbi:MAG TPA: TerB family tellurite resistance protein [Acidimicrobiales bacterium]|nr:TerB family tellurite resistance protein [Acidimicrobiales bacterium]
MSLVARILERFSSDAARDPERDRAVIDLLELVMVVDRHVVEAERASVLEFLEGCDWSDGGGPASYSQQSTARARLAIEVPEELEALLTSAADRLTAPEDREFALRAMSDLAGVDGVVDPNEHALIEGLRARFAESG